MAKKLKELAKRTLDQLVDAAFPRRSARMNAEGSEVLDDTPIAKPVHLQRRGSTLDEVRAAIGLINKEAAQNGEETEDDFYDFDVDDDLPLDTRWTAVAESLDLPPDQLRAYLGIAETPAPNPLGNGAPQPPAPEPPRGRHADDEPPKPPPATGKQKTVE